MGIKIKQSKEKKWVLPGLKLTHKEFIEGVKRSEQGPFYTLDEIKEMRRKWRSSRESQ